MRTVKYRKDVCQSVAEAGRERERNKRIHTQLIRLKSARARLVLNFFRKVILLRKLILTAAMYAEDEERHRR